MYHRKGGLSGCWRARLYHLSSTLNEPRSLHHQHSSRPFLFIIWLLSFLPVGIVLFTLLAASLFATICALLADFVSHLHLLVNYWRWRLLGLSHDVHLSLSWIIDDCMQQWRLSKGDLETLQSFQTYHYEAHLSIKSTLHYYHLYLFRLSHRKLSF